MILWQMNWFINALDLFKLKIKSLTMQTARIVQAVVLMMIMAVAASCAASKEYSSKLFVPRIQEVKDTSAMVLRFLELDNIEPDKETWVTTDIIMGRDTASKITGLDNLAKTIPVVPDSITKSDKAKTIPAAVENNTKSAESEPVVKRTNPGGVRTKKTRE